jgi:hypothetical protein
MTEEQMRMVEQRTVMREIRDKEVVSGPSPPALYCPHQ